MSLPMIVKFTTTTPDYDLLKDATIVDQIIKHSGESVLSNIYGGTAYSNITVFVDSPTKIKFSNSDNYQEFIMNKVYSTNGEFNAQHIYIKDSGVSGTLSIQTN